MAARIAPKAPRAGRASHMNDTGDTGTVCRLARPLPLAADALAERGET